MVGLVCLLAQLGALVHLTVVRHATCAAHGETVHVAGDARDRSERVNGPLVGAVADEASHEDDHCLFVGATRPEGASLVPGAVVAPPFPPPQGLAPFALTMSAATVPPLAFAPKTSPPVALGS